MKLRAYAVALTLLAAGLAAAWWHERAERIVVAEQATRLARQNAELSFELKQARKDKTAYEQRAVALDNQLGSAKSRTTATETKQVQLTRELHETKSRLTEREQREVALMTELATLRQKVASASTPASEEAMVLPTLILTPGMPGSTPGQTESPGAEVAASQPAPAETPLAAPAPTSADELAAYSRRIAELETQLTQLLTRALAEAPAPADQVPSAQPPQAPAIRFQVLRVGPRDSFIVVDCGAEQGARLGVTVSVQRDGQELARARVSETRPNFALAQVQPTTLKGQLQPGDLVVFTQ